MNHHGGGQWCTGSEACDNQNDDLSVVMERRWDEAVRTVLGAVRMQHFGEYVAGEGRVHEAMLEVIDDARADGAQVAIVVMPLHEAFAAEIPERVRKSFAATLDLLAEEHSVPVYRPDVRRWAGDKRPGTTWLAEPASTCLVRSAATWCIPCHRGARREHRKPLEPAPPSQGSALSHAVQLLRLCGIPGHHMAHLFVQRRRLPRLLWLLAISAFFYGCWKPWYLRSSRPAPSCGTSWAPGFTLRTPSAPAPAGSWGHHRRGDALHVQVRQLHPRECRRRAELDGDGLGESLPTLPTALPVGISFDTFQTLSYIIDIHRRRIEPRRSLLDFSVYVFFFPQLVAGPIVRAADFLPQLDRRPRLDWKAIGEGLFLILAGLTKKMVLADTLHHFVVEPFFDRPLRHNTFEVLFAIWSANFQVYCDFSGYTDVATGAALLFGFTLPLNFNRPFWSQTPMEHWRRWHISLGRWLFDYIYIPLGGSRRGSFRTDVNLMITFIVGGIWHGAGWTFIFWGIYNGLALVVWRRWGPREATTTFGRVWRTFLTFNVICVGLIFLHAHSFVDAQAFILGLFNPFEPSTGIIGGWGAVALVAAAALHWTPSWKRALQNLFAGLPAMALALIVLAAGGVLSMFSGLAAPFFYFQF